MWNQTAKFDARAAEARTKRVDFDAADTKCVGQVLVKFASADLEKGLIRSGTGTIVKKIDNDNFAMLTCAHLFDAF